jgi:hypothetical protein
MTIAGAPILGVGQAGWHQRLLESPAGTLDPPAGLGAIDAEKNDPP